MKYLILTFFITTLVCRGASPTVAGFDITDSSINATSGVPYLTYAVAASVAAIQSQIATQALALTIGTNSVSTQSANYAVQSSDTVVLLSGAHTATLPTAVGIPGKSFTIKCTSSGTNGILTTLSQTIDGATKWTNTAINKFTTVISDGANWRVIGQN